MKCPVCGQDCVCYAHEIIDSLPTVFVPCPECKENLLNKRAPPPDLTIPEVCSCGRRFIDDVYLHCYRIMAEEGNIRKDEPLAGVGTPLIHPGFAMTKPPYLPENSLVLLSKFMTKKTAERLFKEVPEVRGILLDTGCVPGLSDINGDGIPDKYKLLAGCDVRADIFNTPNSPVVIYKQQSTMHIEFPRGYDPKIVNVGVKIRHFHPHTFVDACSGAGTLGITGAFYGVPHVIMNDAWYAAAFWSAYNLKVNKEHLNIGSVDIKFSYDEMGKQQVIREPIKIAATTGGEQLIEIYQGDYRLLHKVLPEKVDLSVIDLFEKGEKGKMKDAIVAWGRTVGGEVFIP